MKISVRETSASLDRKKRPPVARRRKVERRKNVRDRRNYGNNGLIVSLSTRFGKRRKRERRENARDRRTARDPNYLVEFSTNNHSAADSGKKEESGAVFDHIDSLDSTESGLHIRVSV